MAEPDTQLERLAASPTSLEERLSELAANSKFICRMNGDEAEAFASDLRSILSELSTLREKNARLVEALKPFSAGANVVSPGEERVTVKLADCRRAAAELEERA